MFALCTDDTQSVNWRHVRDKLMDLGDEDQEIEWSDGEHFPWWLWLANTWNIRDVANDGLARVLLGVRNGSKCGRASRTQVPRVYGWG